MHDRKDSRLPEQLQRAMAAEAEAAREARAKAIQVFFANHTIEKKVQFQLDVKRNVQT